MQATAHRSASAFVALLMLSGCQNWFIFEPDRKLHAAPSDFPFKIVELKLPVRAQGAREEQLNAWWIPAARSPGKTLLYLHGRDSDVSDCVGDVAPLRDLNLSLLLVDYRGFGSSDGVFPSEASVYEDAEAAWTYLVGQGGVRPADLYIYGHSLGGAIAIELARRHPEAAGLIVESSFTSVYQVSRLDRRYRYLPVRLVLNERFESINKVPELRLPTLFVHGTADDTVPFWMGKQLFDAAPEPKRFVAIDGGSHDHDEDGVQVIREAVGRFIEYPPALPPLLPF
jgi:pimeloyl-ACP methyl ester carboxylesterase